MNPDRHRAALRSAASVTLLAILASCLTCSTPITRAGDADPLSALLKKTRATVEKFVDDFSYIRYEEDIVQEKLNEHEKVAYKQETVFDSITRVHCEDGQLYVDEQRVMEKIPRHVEARPLLSTYGFSTMAMIFHPYYESSFRFTRMEDDSLEGRVVARIHFEHTPGRPSPVLYQMIGADKPLGLTGTAWVDQPSGAIQRIEATLTVESNDLPLKTIRAGLTYAPVTLQGETEPRLFPATATIDLETARQHWRNIHRFVDYRKYRVTMNMPGATEQ